MTKTANFIVSGPKLELDGVDELVGDFLFRSLKKLPRDNVFQVMIEPYEKITNGEFFKLCAQISECLVRQGLKKGDVVSLVGDNSSQLHASFIGVIWAGGIPNPVSGQATAYELKVYFERIKPKWIMNEPSDLPSVLRCVETLKRNIKVIALNAAPVSDGSFTRLQDILPDVDMNSFTPKSGGDSKDLAFILCSSGTTGIPKGVALSHSAIMTSFLTWQYMPRVEFVLTQGITSFFPWITGVWFLILGCVYGMGRIITTTNDPEELMKVIEKYKIKGILIPPPQLQSVVESPNFENYDLSSVRCVYTGGSVLGKPTEEKFMQKWKSTKLYSLYGMTESGFITMPSPIHAFESCGIPFYNTTVKIVDVDTGNILEPNQVGEIYIKTNSMFLEYVGDEEATRATKVDGWIRTGDLGYFDENNNLTITARLKEILKTTNTQKLILIFGDCAGVPLEVMNRTNDQLGTVILFGGDGGVEKISPVELEIFISTLDGVSDVGVAGIQVSQFVYHLMALVVKTPGSTITAEDIQNSVAENFSEKKHLKAGVHFITECPRSVSRKLKRNKLNEMAMSFYSKSIIATK